MCHLIHWNDTFLTPGRVTILRPLVMAMNMGIPGGYTGKGTAGTNKDTCFSIRHCTRTRTRHTRTHNIGFTLQTWRLPNYQSITTIRAIAIYNNNMLKYVTTIPSLYTCGQTYIHSPFFVQIYIPRLFFYHVPPRRS